jgi:hypothetical protein
LEVIAFLLVSWARLASGQLPLPIHVIPLGATGGVDRWRTDVTVANVGQRAVVVGIRFFPEQHDNAFDGTFPHSFTLGPGETKTIADATPVDCTVPDRPYPALLAVTARVRRGGTSTLIDSDWLRANVTDGPSVIAGIGSVGGRVTSGRVELGLANISTASLPVRIDLFDGKGRSDGSTLRELPPLSFAMWSLSELGLPEVGGTGRIEVTLRTPTGPCLAAQQPPPCTDPCDRSVCPQRYRFPSTPAFFAFVIESTGASLVYRTPVIDFVGAQRIATAYAQKNCPDVNAAARIMDLFAKLALLRDPTPTLRKVQP